MESPRLHVVPEDTPDGPSPLTSLRMKRRMTVEEAAARAGLPVDEVRCLEERRIYRFPSIDRALSSTLVYATSLGLSAREARGLAGLPLGPRGGWWSPRRWLALATFAGALAALAWFAVIPEFWPGEKKDGALVAFEKTLPPPWEIRVDVFNGTQVPNAATQLANEMGGPLAYRIGTVENANRLDYVATRVYYPPGSEAIAKRLADELGIETAALPGKAEPNRLVVIVGADVAGRSS